VVPQLRKENKGFAGENQPNGSCFAKSLPISTSDTPASKIGKTKKTKQMM
jgi:uncharacterized membrane protein